MKNNRLLGIALWGISLTVECLLLLCLTRIYSAVVWITLGFTLFTFISQLALWLYVWHKPLNANNNFLHMPLFTISLWYIILQAVPCLLFAFWQTSAQIAALTNAAISVVMWGLLILSMIVKGYIEKVDGRQENHRVKL